jgi:hypothetical protein
LKEPFEEFPGSSFQFPPNGGMRKNVDANENNPRFREKPKSEAVLVG